MRIKLINIEYDMLFNINQMLIEKIKLENKRDILLSKTSNTWNKIIRWLMLAKHKRQADSANALKTLNILQHEIQVLDEDLSSDHCALIYIRGQLELFKNRTWLPLMFK